MSKHVEEIEYEDVIVTEEETSSSFDSMLSYELGSISTWTPSERRTVTRIAKQSYNTALNEALLILSKESVIHAGAMRKIEHLMKDRD